jgi:hypothetical protein
MWVVTIKAAVNHYAKTRGTEVYQQWIGYYDSSSTKQARKDTLWEGRGRVIQTGDSPEDSVTTDWYSFDWNS